MDLFARIYFFVFGLVTIAGGVVGFVKANSKPSLIAGSIAGVLLVGAAALIGAASSREAVAPAALVSLLLAGRFVPAYAKTRATMPAGLMAALSLVGVVVAAGTVLSR